MIIRALLSLTAGVALAACQPAVPDSGRGVGFGTGFEQEQRQRDAALTGIPAVAPINSGPINPAPLGAPIEGSAQATAAQTTAVLDATRPGGLGNDAATNSGLVPLNASPSNPAPDAVNDVGISDENSFDAVSGQRSIESDAARIASNRAQYEVVQPEALPDRQSDGPNIVAFALKNQHAVGQSIYSRGMFSSAGRAARNCAKYASADQAQIEFLSRGGPENDRGGLDPDGDGYACDWDPRPFRRAASEG